MIINNNIPALNTHRQMGINQNAMQNSMEKLSSGLRINRAGDDAAGLAISEKMRAQINGLDQASRNAQDGISLIQTAEGALNETHDILQRMREISVQSANDTNTDDDRAELQKELDALIEEVDRIAQNTEFNTQELLDGTYDAKEFHIGANETQSITISIGDMQAAALGIDSLSINDQASADGAIATLDAAIKDVSSERADLGAIQNRLEHTISNLDNASENLSAAESRIRDVDMASEMMEMTRANILSQASQSMLAQANQQPQSVLQLLG
ncbi:flagellin N-terminal helical domain-containing protein [Salisediminibacterium selenitireducens]|uniref:Flagellin n=1 Tax=Bacillus selenitireducens (strain ATCC 700615 / DSM 15326 / MLS10) TaxID=439292 RepID=D6Y0G2_BACIE|nr:flagellin [Salisediminibacterium selenitireducens]ADH98553.1 flagellin domain protein [[Bacillus] selenitireducens MLS10]